MAVTPANAIPTRKSTPRSAPKAPAKPRGTGTAGRSPEKRADVTETPAPSALPVVSVEALKAELAASVPADPAAEIARLKEELAAARAAAKATKAAKKSEHESGYRGALTKPVDGKVADFCAWVEKHFPEMGTLSERERRFVLITLRSYGTFQAEVNGRIVSE